MPQVAILNTTSEMIELFQNILMEEGITSVADYIPHFKQGTTDVATFFATHRPQVVLYDVAIPYDDNWHFLHQVVIPQSSLQPHHFVLTTTNKAALEHFVGATTAIEVIGRPFDLAAVLQAVQRALERP